jgi:two-component system OmpR family sensor kinase
MTPSWKPLSFRAKLTLWWSVTFGLLLAIANLAIYLVIDVYLARDLDRKVRTVAATELASSTDGPGVHLHEFTRDALSGGEFADKFVQIFDADGRVRLASQAIRASPPLVDRNLIGSALEGRAPLVNLHVAGRTGRAAVLRTEVRGERYAILVGLFRDDIDAHLTRLAWLLGFVWIGGLAATAALGYWLASRALLPVVGISRRAARIAQGDFAARLDPPAHLDELGEMTALLNTMLNRLHGSLEAHRRFAADASHELRAPITAMTGEIDVTLRRPRTAAEYRETLVVVGERLSALSSLCEDLMLLAHAQEGAQAIDLREVPLLPQLHQSAARLADAASSREIGIEARDLPDLVVHVNPRLLARVLDNVLVNAVAYNRTGGLVVVSGAAHVAHSETWTPEMVVITVKDTGAGIPADQFERVFDRFYRLDPSRTPGAGGSGLGLAICREVLTVLRGSIRITDSSEAGTTFVIELPGRLASDRRVSELLGNPAGMAWSRSTVPGSATREAEHAPIV